MTKTTTLLSSTVLAAGSFAALAAPALAQDATAFADRLAATYSTFGIALEMGAVSGDGGTVTIEGITVTIPEMPAGEDTIPLETTFTFSGVVEAADGSFTADTMTIPDIVFTIDDTDVSLADVVISGIYLPPADAIDTLAAMQSFGSLTTGPLSVVKKGTEVFAYDDLVAETTYTPGQGVADLESAYSVVEIASWRADLSSVDDPEISPVIDMLDARTLTGSLRQSVDWTFADGRMVVDESSITVDGLARFDINFDIIGYTVDLLDEITSASQRLAQIEDEEEMAAAEMELGMTMLQALEIAGFTFRYEDDSLFERLIEVAATAEGLSVEEFVEATRQLIPEMLLAIPDPDLAEQIEIAVNSFLDDPQSFTVRIQPAEPIGMMALPMVLIDPSVASQLLGLTVTAND